MRPALIWKPSVSTTPTHATSSARKFAHNAFTHPGYCSLKDHSYHAFEPWCPLDLPLGIPLALRLASTLMRFSVQSKYGSTRGAGSALHAFHILPKCHTCRRSSVGDETPI